MSDMYITQEGSDTRDVVCRRCGAQVGEDCHDEMTKRHLIAPHAERVVETMRKDRQL